MLRKIARRCDRLLQLLLGLFLLGLYNEFAVYYLTLWKCSWPSLLEPGVDASNKRAPLRAMVLADTHLLGPMRGHWADKLRREWEMERAFQTAITLFRPEVVFLLGDVFDEGEWVDDEGWREYLRRFRSIFRRDADVPLVVVPGNHDVGFHHVVAAVPHLRSRFSDVFPSDEVGSFVLKNVTFVLINSMAFEGDDCSLCRRAETQLRSVARDLECARRGSAKPCKPRPRRELPPSPPVLLQHFPLFRRSDESCSEPDEAPPAEKTTPFREKWDCVSRESTERILSLIEPRLILSGHTHHGCLTRHPSRGERERTLIPEYSVSSFSWRNRNNPAFLLTVLSANNSAVSKCYLPEESSVLFNYSAGSAFLFAYALLPWAWLRRLVASFLRLVLGDLGRGVRSVAWDPKTRERFRLSKNN